MSKMLQKPMIIDKYNNANQPNNMNQIQSAIQKSN
jgi:hypothetical protein